MPFVLVSLLLLVAAAFAWVVYHHAGAFSSKRFPRTAAALGPIYTRLGAAHGAVEGVPVSVHILTAAASGQARDVVTVRSPSPGAAATLTLRSVPRPVDLADPAPRASADDDFAAAFTAEGRPRADVEALVSEEARALLTALTRMEAPVRPARAPKPVGYRNDGRGADKPEALASPVELRVGGDEVVLTLTTRDPTDEQLYAAVRATAKCARRALNRPFVGSALPRRTVAALVTAVSLFGAGYGLVARAHFVSGVEGVSSASVWRERRAIFRHTLISVRNDATRERVMLSVPDDAVSRCAGVTVRREPLSLSFVCGDERITDVSPLAGALSLAASLVAFAVVWRDRRRPSSDLQW